MTTPIYSLSLSAEAILDMHSLNNEGGEGNQIQTRMVNIVDKDGRLHNVNAVSGDMFKHIQAEHFFRASNGRVPLCAGCKQFDANRICADTDFEKYVVKKEVSDAAATDRLLQTCALDDTAGILVTTGGRSLPRKSVIEFGWVLALPEASATDSYFHVKYAKERSPDQLAKDSAEAARGSNLGQAIFHRPASSGVYAVVSTLEPVRIGFNDITQQYVIEDDDRQERHKVLLESLLYTFIQPNGAMRTTQHPHLVDFRGVVGLSSEIIPAPTISPLNESYEQELEQIAASLNKLRPNAIVLRPFDSLAQFTDIMTELIKTTVPYKLNYTS